MEPDHVTLFEVLVEEWIVPSASALVVVSLWSLPGVKPSTMVRRWSRIRMGGNGVDGRCLNCDWMLKFMIKPKIV